MAFLKAADLEQQHSEMVARMVAIVEQAKAEDRELLDDEQAEIDSIELDLPKVEANLNRIRAVDARQAALIQSRHDSGTAPQSDAGGPQSLESVVVPARAKSSGQLKVYESERDAYIAGNVILAGIFGNAAAGRFCDSHGLRISNAQSEGSNPKGGFVVPDEMQRAFVRLREERGIFPQYARSYPMGSDTLFVPRDIADVTAYWVGEAAAITESDKDISGAELIAKKLACLTKVSSELDEDSVVDIGEMVTRSMAYAMADKIDEAGFNGDGTSAYGGVTGLKNAMHANGTNDAASGNVSAATLDLADFEGTAGLLPEYGGSTNVWFMHKAFYYASIIRLQNASGGTAGMEIGAGQERQIFGYPVQFTQVMPSAPGVSTICAYLGDLSLAATVGTRRGVQTQVSVDRYFENDQIGIKCTERCAINVHERGDTVLTRPIVALKTAAS